MNKLYLGFSTPKGFNIVSKLIHFFEKTPFSHVYVRMESGWLQRDVIYEASGTSVHFKAKPLWLKSCEVIAEFEVDLTDGTYKKVMQFCMDNAGSPYGLKSLFGFFFVCVGKIFGKVWRNPFRDGESTYICSELGAVVLRDFAGDIQVTDTDDMTPKMLFQHAISRYKRVT